MHLALLAVLHFFGWFADKPGELPRIVGLASAESKRLPLSELPPLTPLRKRDSVVKSNFLSVGTDHFRAWHHCIAF